MLSSPTLPTTLMSMLTCPHTSGHLCGLGEQARRVSDHGQLSAGMLVLDFSAAFRNLTDSLRP